MARTRPSASAAVVLVVAQQVELQQQLALALARAGLQAQPADSDRAALAVLDRQPAVAAMIIDSDLPITGGYEVARMVRRHPRGGDLPLVLLTDARWSQAQKRAAAQQLGPLEIVGKPLDADALVARLLHDLPPATSPTSWLEATAREQARTAAATAISEPLADALFTAGPVTQGAPGSPAATGRAASQPAEQFAAEPLADWASHDEQQQVEDDTREAQSQPLRTRGNLQSTPFPALLHGLYRERASGALFLLRDNIKKIVYFQEGHPVFVKSNLLSECLGKVLVKEQLITSQDCEESLKRMRKTRRQQGTVLVELGVISPQNLVVGLELQLQTKLLDIFGWSRGEYLLKPDARVPAEVIQLPMSNASLIAEGIRCCWTEERTQQALAPLLERYLAPTTDPQLRFQELMLDELEQSLLDDIDGTKTLREVLGNSPLPDARARAVAYILIATGVAEARDEPLPEPVHELAAEPDDEGTRREALGADLLALRNRDDPFAILGVSPSANDTEIEQAYSALARQSHPDRYRRYSAATRKLARELFGVYFAAYEQVATAELRARYRNRYTDAELESIPDSGGRLLLAERSSQRVKTLVEQERWSEALGELERLVVQYDDDAELHAMLGWVSFHCAPDDPRTARSAIGQLRKAIELHPRSHRAYLYLGRIYALMGKRILAEKQFERALQCNPSSGEALAELRIQQELRPPRRRRPTWSPPEED